MTTPGRVQRVDGPSPAVVVLTLYSPEHGKRLLLFDARADSFRWIPQRPKGDPADGFVRRLRKLLVGAHLEHIERKGARVRAGFQLRNRFAWLLAERGAPVLREDDGRPLAGRARFAGAEIGDGWTSYEPEVSDATPASSDVDRERQELRTRIRAHLRKLRRKAQAIAKDASRAEGAPRLRHEAELITAHLHQWKGQPSLAVNDWESGEARTIAIDPQLGAKAQADKLFRMAKRFERGAEIARQRLSEVEHEIAAAEALREALTDEVTIEALHERAVELGIAKRQAPPGRKREQARTPHRTFFSGEQRILVGKGPNDNDALTLDARPHHHWLHARGVGGAHVIVPLNKNAQLGSEVLVDAATLAAHFSKARGDDRVEVQHTERRHVRKPRGFPPGAVRVTREKVIVVRMEPDRLRRLLASER